MMRCFALSLVCLVVSCAKPSKRAETVAKPRQVAQTVESLSDRFVRELKIGPGLYLAVNDPSETCFEGDLEVLQVDDTLSVMFGGRLIMGGVKLDGNQMRFNENGCQNVVQVTRRGNLFQRIQQRTCGRTQTEITTTLTFAKLGEISYSILSRENGRLKNRLQCALQRSEQVVEQ